MAIKLETFTDMGCSCRKKKSSGRRWHVRWFDFDKPRRNPACVATLWEGEKIPLPERCRLCRHASSTGSLFTGASFFDNHCRFQIGSQPASLFFRRFLSAAALTHEYKQHRKHGEQAAAYDMIRSALSRRMREKTEWKVPMRI